MAHDKRLTGEYSDSALVMRDRLNEVSPSFCLAKWLQVSLHLPQGMTQSCYHPPTHSISLDALKKSPSALHNTPIKIIERQQMLTGERPPGCSYCWRMEDAAGSHLSDRHYRSSEHWAEQDFEKIVNSPANFDVAPRYMEVNFNQACNFKCVYCSPHLSTTWEEEIKKFGPYKLKSGAHNSLAALQLQNLMPLKVAQTDNPYIQAFWEWWPNIYRNLRVFRMTGGEPLMDKNTFRVLEYVNEHPHGQLELSITSNLCPPDPKLFDKFISAVQKLETVRSWEDLDNKNEHSGNYRYVAPAYKHFMLFVSLDAVGDQAEYIRTGMDYSVLLSNVKRYLRETRHTSVSFINTFNLLSIPSLTQFLNMILELRKEFGGRLQTEYTITPPNFGEFVHPPYVVEKFQRVWFDLPVLRYPNWFSIQNATSSEISALKESLAFMEANVQKSDYLETFEGFKPYEILKIKRNLALMEEPLSQEQQSINMTTFYQFIAELDDRRNTNFQEVFPSLAQYYRSCRKSFITTG